MFIIYRGLGLAWAALGVLVLLVVMLATGSIGIALTTVAAGWIYFGRGDFEPRWFQDEEQQDQRQAPTVFFIPIWVYGLLVVPIALGATTLELIHGRVLTVPENGEQHVGAEDRGAAQHDRNRRTPEPAVENVEAGGAEADFDGSDIVSTSDRLPDGEDEVQHTSPPADKVPPVVQRRHQGGRSSSTFVPPHPRHRSKFSPPSISGPKGPGEPVTSDTILGPGQKLAGYWGGKWSQVLVTGFQGQDVLTAWVHSNTWTSFRMSRKDLRLVSDSEFAECRKKYNDVPITHPPLSPTLKVSRNERLLCRVSDYWLPVETTGPESDQGVPIHWTGFDKEFDEVVDRSRLARGNSGRRGK